MKKKSFLTLLLSVVSSFSFTALADTPAMEITMSNGEQIQVELASDSFGLTRLNETKDAILFYVISGAMIRDENGNFMPDYNPENPDKEPWKILFEKELSSMNVIRFRTLVSSIDSPVDRPSISLILSDGTLRVKGVSDEVSISILDSSGILLDRINISEDSEIQFSKYGSGVRIINVDGEIMKLLVK